MFLRMAPEGCLWLPLTYACMLMHTAHVDKHTYKHTCRIHEQISKSGAGELEENWNYGSELQGWGGDTACRRSAWATEKVTGQPELHKKTWSRG